MVSPVTVHSPAFLGATRLRATSLGGLVAGRNAVAHVTVAPATVAIATLDFQALDLVVDGNDAWAVGHGHLSRFTVSPFALVSTVLLDTPGTWIARVDEFLVVPGLRGGLLLLNEAGAVVSDCSFGKSVVIGAGLPGLALVVLNGGEVRLLSVDGDHLVEQSRLQVGHASYTYRIATDGIDTAYLLTVHRAEVIELDCSDPENLSYTTRVVRDAVPISALYTRESELFPVPYPYDDVADVPGGLMALSESGLVQFDEDAGPLLPLIAMVVSSLTAPATVQFSVSGVAGAGLTYAWDFGDGGTSVEAAPTHVYEDTGVFTVSVTVHDSSFNEATAVASVVIASSVGASLFNFAHIILVKTLPTRPQKPAVHNMNTRTAL